MSCELTPLALHIGFFCVTTSEQWHPPTFSENSLVCCTQALIIIVFLIDSQEYECFTEAQMSPRKFQSCRVAS